MIWRYTDTVCRTDSRPDFYRKCAAAAVDCPKIRTEAILVETTECYCGGQDHCRTWDLDAPVTEVQIRRGVEGSTRLAFEDRGMVGKNKDI